MSFFNQALFIFTTIILTVRADPKVEPEVEAFYGGTLDSKAMKQLFPYENDGCINFGFWNTNINEKISLEKRVKSQFELYKQALDHIDLKNNQKILEIGCGRGHGLSFVMKTYQVDVFGIDAVKEQINRCQLSYPEISNNFSCNLADQLPFEDKTFDHAYSIEAAQHFPDFEAFVNEAYRVLKPGGVLVISTFFFPHEKAKKEIGKILPPGFEGTHYVISIGKAHQSLIKAGFSEVDPISIGKNTFHGFCEWAKQNQPKDTHSQHWVDAYNEGLLDYYILIAKKPKTDTN